MEQRLQVVLPPSLTCKEAQHIITTLEAAGGKAMGDVGTAQLLAFGLRACGSINAREIARPRWFAARNDFLCNRRDDCMDRHGLNSVRDTNKVSKVLKWTDSPKPAALAISCQDDSMLRLKASDWQT